VHLVEVEQSKVLPSCFSSHTLNKYPFCGVFSAVFAFLSFLFVILLFKVAPKCSTEVLSGVPKGKKALMCLTEKIHC